MSVTLGRERVAKDPVSPGAPSETPQMRRQSTAHFTLRGENLADRGRLFLPTEECRPRGTAATAHRRQGDLE
jgi:hypothetical protein